MKIITLSGQPDKNNYFFIENYLGVVYKAGDRLLYHPDQPPQSRIFIPTPALFNLPFENLFIKSRYCSPFENLFIKSRYRSKGGRQ